MERVYLGVGSNLGDRPAYLEKAQSLIAKLPKSRLLQKSTVSETDPIGGPGQPKYLNAVWEIETKLSPGALKEKLRAIEETLGRKRPFPNAPREMDLDILFYGDQIVLEDDLQIPHPRLHERTFVLEPLAELVPEKIHPILRKTVAELLQKLKSKHENLS